MTDAQDRIKQVQEMAAAGIKGVHIAARLGVPYEDLRGAMRFLGIKPATKRQLQAKAKAKATAMKLVERKAAQRARWEEKQRAIEQRKAAREGLGLRVRRDANYGAPIVRTWGAHDPFAAGVRNG